jgi:hypothetical protein
MVIHGSSGDSHSAGIKPAGAKNMRVPIPQVRQWPSAEASHSIEAVGKVVDDPVDLHR